MTCIHVEQVKIVSLHDPQRDITYFPKCASSEDSDQTAHPRSLIRVFAGRMKNGCINGYPKYANAQADLNLCWTYMSKGTLSDDGAHVNFLMLYLFKEDS